MHHGTDTNLPHIMICSPDHDRYNHILYCDLSVSLSIVNGSCVTTRHTVPTHPPASPFLSPRCRVVSFHSTDDDNREVSHMRLFSAVGRMMPSQYLLERQ
jgi:hypothetical protein